MLTCGNIYNFSNARNIAPKTPELLSEVLPKIMFKGKPTIQNLETES